MMKAKQNVNSHPKIYLFQETPPKSGVFFFAQFDRNYVILSLEQKWYFF